MHGSYLSFSRFEQINERPLFSGQILGSPVPAPGSTGQNAIVTRSSGEATGLAGKRSGVRLRADNRACQDRQILLFAQQL